MRVLMLGGTGAMGTHLASLLLKSGEDVVITTRQVRISAEGERYIQGDAQQLEFMEELLKGSWDAIVDFMIYSTQDFKARVELLLRSTSHYVFLSSARVYADSKNPIVESSVRLLDSCDDREFLLTDEYSLTKARQEDVLTASQFNNWTIIRPYITYSEDRMQLGVFEKEAWLYRALQGRSIVFSEDIVEKETTLTYGFDVAKGIEAVVGNPDAFGQIYHITAGTSIKWKEVLDIYLDVLESHLSRRPAVFFKDLQGFCKLHSAAHQVLYDRIFDRKFNSMKINKHVDVGLFVDARDGLKECLESFLKAPDFKEINWKSEALKDRETGEKAMICKIPGLRKKIKYLLFRYLLN